jgi:hypothetical protein
LVQYNLILIVIIIQDIGDNVIALLTTGDNVIALLTTSHKLGANVICRVILRSDTSFTHCDTLSTVMIRN